MWVPRDAKRFVATAALAALASAAGAQPCPTPYDCDPPSPDGGWSLGRSPGAGGFIPDRRPVYWFNLYCGDKCRSCEPVLNPKGQAPYWALADWPTLEKQLDALFDAGFRRIVLQRPAGSLPGESKLNQSQYHHLTEEQKSVIQNELADWIACRRAGCDSRPAAPDLQMAVFIGSWQNEVCSPCLTDTGGIGAHGVVWWECPPDAEMHFMNPEDPQSLDDIYANVAPWAEAGFDAIWFDNASRRDPDWGQSPDALLALRNMPEFSSLMLGGEAVPWYKVNGQRYIDIAYAEQAPWFAVYWWYRRSGWLGPKAVAPATVDPSTTELGVVFGETPERGDQLDSARMVHSIHEVADARDRGFVIWASHTTVIPYVRRLYDGNDDAFFASLVIEDNPADFNADGRVDCADYIAFLRNWTVALGSATEDVAFWDGDINNDDKVNADDLATFAGLADWSPCSP